MKILHVVLGFPPAVAFGGTARAVSNIATGLSSRGYFVHVLTTNRLNKRQKLSPASLVHQLGTNLSVTRLDTWCLPMWPGFMGPAVSLGLGAWLRAHIHDFDLVHIHGYRDHLALGTSRLATRANVPYILQPHGSLPVVLRSFWVKRLYDRLFGQQELSNASIVIALTEAERRQCLQRGVQLDKVRVVPNGYVDLSSNVAKRMFLRERVGITPEDLVLLFLGSLNYNKGVDILVEAFAMLEPSSHVHLVIVGPDDGAMRQIREQIKHRELDHGIHLLGQLCGDDVFAAYADADVFVLPARKDTFSMSIIEACMMGVPLIVSESCEVASLVESNAGLVVKSDPRHVADALKAVVSNSQLRRQYSRGARRLFEQQFLLDRVLDKLEEIYEHVLLTCEQGVPYG